MPPYSRIWSVKNVEGLDDSALPPTHVTFSIGSFKSTYSQPTLRVLSARPMVEIWRY